MATHPTYNDADDEVGEAREDGRFYVGSSKAREHLSDLLNRAAYRGERFIVDRHGKPLAAIVPVSDLDHLEELEDAADREAADEARADDVVDWESAKREMDD